MKKTVNVEPRRVASMRSRRRARPAIGPQVRRLRHERGLTLARVAERSGLNVGYLSQIENDKASPSLESLTALAGAMEVPITWFLVESAPPPRVVRFSKRRRWRGPGGVHVEEVDGGIPREVRVIQVTNAPGQSTGAHAHPGDEHHIVLSGRVRATQAGNTVDLGPGDYLLWDATLPHEMESVGPEPSVVILFSHRGQGTEAAPDD
jgi:transcriptional regulator with XRE-family HTH domain